MEIEKKKRGRKPNATPFNAKEYAKQKNKEMLYCDVCDRDISYYCFARHKQRKSHILKLSNQILNDKEKLLQRLSELEAK